MDIWFKVFQVAQAVVMGAVAILLLTFRLGGKSKEMLDAPGALGRRIVDVEGSTHRTHRDLSELEKTVQVNGSALAEMQRRSDEDHDRLRKLIEVVNAHPATLASYFLTRNESQAYVQESQRDRERLQREVDTIWSVLRNVENRDR